MLRPSVKKIPPNEPTHKPEVQFGGLIYPAVLGWTHVSGKPFLGAVRHVWIDDSKT